MTAPDQHPRHAGHRRTDAATAAATCAVLRAAARLIESSGAGTRLHVSCTDRSVTITVLEPVADTDARIIQAAKIAGQIGAVLRQADRAEVPVSDLTASGWYQGIPVKVATMLMVRHSGNRADSLPLACTAGGEVTALRGSLPSGWRWVTELDPAPERIAASPARPGRPRRAPSDSPPLTSTTLLAASQAGPAAPASRPGTAARPARLGR